MALTKENKVKILEKFRVHESDTGSPEIQIALLTNRINEVTDHLKKHKKDFYSRRSLLIMVGRRRRLLNYVKKNDAKKYENLLKELKIRR